MTAQGSPLTRYRRAIESQSILPAERSAREMGFVTLPDALALVALYASEASPRFDKAAVRWLARYALERDDVRLADVQLAAAALAALPARGEPALRVLLELCRTPRTQPALGG